LNLESELGLRTWVNISKLWGESSESLYKGSLVVRDYSCLRNVDVE